MKRTRSRAIAALLSFALALSTSTAYGETTSKRLASQLEVPSDIRALAVSDTAIALVGESIQIISTNSTDMSGSINLTSTNALLFTDITTAQGNFFAIGLGESATALSSTAPTNLINPDSVTTSTTSSQSQGITRLVLIEFLPTGEIVRESIYDADRPLLPLSVRVIGDEIAIVGRIASDRGIQGFFARSDLAGNWLSFTRIGDGSTEIRSIASLRTLYGASSERIAGSDRRGIRDGIIFFLDSSGEINRVVRSHLASSERSWNEASSAHLAVGPIKRGKTEEVAITKFSPQGVPQWFLRFPGSDPHLELRRVGLITSKKLSGIARISPKGKNALFIEFDAKGFNKRATIKSVNSIPAREIVDLADGYAVIVDREGRSQLIPLAP